MAQVILHGDCVALMRDMDDESIPAIVTDPPYGLSFMGRDWDRALPPPEAWQECLRVLRPGGHMVAFGSPRLYHRLACSIEDQGFEIRDCLMWLYGTGFPKSAHNVDGLGTALKPAWEPIVLARKPLGMTIAECVETHETGVIDIDAARVGASGGTCARLARAGSAQRVSGLDGIGGPPVGLGKGRWPSNVAADEVASTMIDAVSGAPRFFYAAKASTEERERGLDGFESMYVDDTRAEGSAGRASPRAGAGRSARRKNTHPTVKPISLMRWLVRMVGRGGPVLDPFSGSGTTGVACALERVPYIGCELDARHVAVSRARIAHARAHGEQPAPNPRQTELFTDFC